MTEHDTGARGLGRPGAAAGEPAPQSDTARGRAATAGDGLRNSAARGAFGSGAASQVLPATLRQAVARDLKPVVPLASPARRTLALLPLGLLLLIGIPVYWGMRVNSATLGSAGTWGLSGLQTLAGLLIVGAALREAIPGRTLSARALAATIASGAVVIIGTTLVTEAMAPTMLPASLWARYAWECFWMAGVSGLPAVATVAWLVSRALPTRPAIAGAIYGLGAGLMGDAGTRLFCWVSSPSHVLIAHGGAVLFFVLFGALAATIIDRFRDRRPS